MHKYNPSTPKVKNKLSSASMGKSGVWGGGKDQPINMRPRAKATTVAARIPSGRKM